MPTMRDAAVFAARKLQDQGHTAYLAGGCVRDEVLGQMPKDYDIATSATPDQVEKLFPGAGLVGKAFGVVIVRIGAREGIGLKHPATIEVATFRSDGSYTDARRPDSVEFSDEHEDAKRRDFTINALFLDPLGGPSPDQPSHVQGRLIDHVGGLADLSARIVRAVGTRTRGSPRTTCELCGPPGSLRGLLARFMRAPRARSVRMFVTLQRSVGSGSAMSSGGC